jgi:hypothetical protein
LSQSECVYGPETITVNYVDVLERIVAFFAVHQDGSGAIIDPFYMGEAQYSTPQFALAGATVTRFGRTNAFLEPSIRSIDHCCRMIRDVTFIEGHNDFFVPTTIRACVLLRDMVSEDMFSRWEDDLSSNVAKDLYSGESNNWNTMAMTGEFMRVIYNMTGSLAFVEQCLEWNQLPRISQSGLYDDADARRNQPSTYDIFGRTHLTDLLLLGYSGRRATILRLLMEQGAKNSLMMMDPNGQLPTGGRTENHIWGDAVQIAFFEMWSVLFQKKGEAMLASQCKRAARLAFSSVLRWERETGDFWVVKNRFDLKERWGFEDYSFYANYNLCLAHMLAIARYWLDDNIGEELCPPEMGGYLTRIPEQSDKIVANALGHSIEVQGGRHDTNSYLGITRVARRGVDVRLSHAAGAPEGLPGPVWDDNHYALHLSSLNRDYCSWHLVPVLVTPTLVRFIITYRIYGIPGGNHGTTQLFFRRRMASIAKNAWKWCHGRMHAYGIPHGPLDKLRLTFRRRPVFDAPMKGHKAVLHRNITLTPKFIVIEDSYSGGLGSFAECFPLHKTDGTEPAEHEIRHNILKASLPNGSKTATILDKALEHPRRARSQIPYDYGEKSTYFSKVSGTTARFVICSLTTDEDVYGSPPEVQMGDNTNVVRIGALGTVAGNIFISSDIVGGRAGSAHLKREGLPDMSFSPECTFLLLRKPHVTVLMVDEETRFSITEDTHTVRVTPERAIDAPSLGQRSFLLYPNQPYELHIEKKDTSQNSAGEGSPHLISN